MADEDGVYSYCVLPTAPTPTPAAASRVEHRPPRPHGGASTKPSNHSSLKNKLFNLYRHAQQKGGKMSRSKSADTVPERGITTTWTFHRCIEQTQAASDVYEIPTEPVSTCSSVSTSSGCSSSVDVPHLATTEDEIDRLLHGYTARPPTVIPPPAAAAVASTRGRSSSKSLPRSASVSGSTRKSCLKSTSSSSSSSNAMNTNTSTSVRTPPRKTVSIQELHSRMLRDSTSQPELSTFSCHQRAVSDVYSQPATGTAPTPTPSTAHTLVTRAIISSSTSSEDCGFAEEEEEDTETSTLYERIDDPQQPQQRPHRTFSSASSTSSSTASSLCRHPRESWTSSSSADSTEVQALTRLFQCMRDPQYYDQRPSRHKLHTNTHK